MNFVRTLPWPGREDEATQLDREWIVTNGLGGTRQERSRV